MVEYGKVKVFYGQRSISKKQFGFIWVTDQYGNKTGEEVFFHIEGARGVVPIEGEERGLVWWDTANVPFTGLGREPREGDFVVFETFKPPKGRKARKAHHWTYKRIWDAAVMESERIYDIDGADEDFDEDEYYRDDEDNVSTTDVYRRAYAHFGNHEQAREATEMYPGDFC